MKTPKDIRAYFMSRVVIPDDPMACWIWTGYKNDQGYGTAFVNREKIKAHRLSYMLFVGPIPDGLEIMHDPVLCNNRGCPNYRHLRPGTHKENMDDKHISQTLKRGAEHHWSLLTEPDVLDILRLFHEDRLMLREIADRKGCSIQTIYGIIHRKNWQHVAPDLYPAPSIDLRSTRKLSHTLSDAQVEALCRAHHTEGVTFYRLAKTYHVGHTMAARIYERWLQAQTTVPVPLPLGAAALRHA